MQGRGEHFRYRPKMAESQSVTLILRLRGGAEAIAFYEKAFGAVERDRMTAPDGTIPNARLTIGNSEVMLSDEAPEHSPGPQTLGGSSVSIALKVSDVDAVVARAVAAGARVVFPVEDRFYGMRDGRIVDPFGHIWIVGTPIAPAH